MKFYCTKGRESSKASRYHEVLLPALFYSLEKDGKALKVMNKKMKTMSSLTDAIFAVIFSALLITKLSSENCALTSMSFERSQHTGWGILPNPWRISRCYILFLENRKNLRKFLLVYVHGFSISSGTMLFKIYFFLEFPFRFFFCCFMPLLLSRRRRCRCCIYWMRENKSDEKI